MWRWLFDFFFPKFCVLCGRVDTWLCLNCQQWLIPAVEVCPHCRRDSLEGRTHPECRTENNGLEGLTKIYFYRHPKIKKMVAAIKYQFLPGVITKVVGNTQLPKINFDLITYIPLHKRRQNWRGFNQAEKLAERMGDLSGIPVLNTLERTKYTKPLANAKSARDRKKEIKNVFRLKPGVSVKHKSVVLVDDVFTSGATMLEAAGVLKQNGAKLIWGWALAG